jgi:type II secretory pathway component GspD/PulD (secretin)
MTIRRSLKRMAGIFACVCLSISFGIATTNAQSDANDPLISLAMRDTDLAEVMEMLSRAERVNILLSEGVGGEVSFSLYDVPLSEAIRSISSAAGYAAELRNGTYFIVERDDVGDYAESDLTQVRTFRIQYADPALIQEMLRPYLSEYGQLMTLAESKILMVEDTPASLRQIATLVSEIDQQPKQILIEAKILEVTLDSEDAYGIDWSNSHTDADGTTTVGTRGLEGAGSSGSAGLFFEIANLNLTAMLSALE